MSAVFFEQLELPHPDYYLGVGGGSHTQQTAKIMLAFEEILAAEQPDLVLVVGDVNSTIACALVAVKMGIPVAHVEAGLRSGDRRMPEEINRMLTDTISDLLFVTEPSGITNLQKEGIPSEKIYFTGNCMIDSLVFYQEKSARMAVLESYKLRAKNYVLITMHRPSNVDTKAGLETIQQMIALIAPQHPVVFPIHPRTRSNFEQHGLFQALEAIPNLTLLEPQGYLEFQQLMTHATAVLTDSGGVQEETTYLQVPCLTFRESTERPVTVEVGSNELLSELDPVLAYAKVKQILNGDWKQGKVPDLWDGKAAQRIVAVIYQQFCVQLSHS
jgi:UDP-N-acetylglucosamine 2-epimerase (non-hydrolysing)